VTRRILGNARAAETERLRNVARAELGSDATDDAIEGRVLDLVRQKLSAAGRKGRQLQAERQAEADRVRAGLPDIELLLLAALDHVRSLTAQPVEAETP
jgi:hypothetical protein